MSDLTPPSTLAFSDLEKLRSRLSEVSALLKSQQDVLRTRGMSLPPGAQQSLESLDRGLSAIEQHMVGEETELAQLRALATTSAMINSSLDMDEVLARAMDEVIRLTGAERGYIVLREPETGKLAFRVSRVGDGDGSDSGFQGSKTILNDVMSSGEPLVTDNAYKDPRMQGHISVSQMVLRSVLCVPLKFKGEVGGAVYVDNRLKEGVFTERERNVLVAFANQVAVAIENARLFARVQTYLAEVTALQQLMTNVFDSIGSGVITTDSADHVRSLNPAAIDILGRAEDQVVGQPLSVLLSPITVDFIHTIRERNQREVLETELQISEDTRKLLSIKISPLKDVEQQIQGVAVVVDDITAQHEREEKLNILRRYLPPAMVDNIHHIAGLALGGERREMTCLYVDVRPFSTFPSDLRPKQVMELLNEYLSVATECINQQDGVLDKYMGTEIMALFNTQLNPQPDHAYRALMTALTMRDAFAALYEWQGIQPEPHYYRIGLHSGVATTGNVGSLSRRDFTALGDAINLAHRLLENAEPGQIVVSADSLDYIRAAMGQPPSEVEFRERDPIKAKGRQQTTVVYEVFRTS